jgi:hypothetical protein
MSMVYWASYKGTHAGLAGVVNRGIRRATSSPYSHTELCIGNPFEGVVSCLSASGVDHGVRRKDMQLNPDKWDILELHWADANDVSRRFAAIQGHPYDFWGTSRFAAPLIAPVRQHPTAWFCTEACLFMLGLVPNEEWRLDPASGHALVVQVNRLVGT